MLTVLRPRLGCVSDATSGLGIARQLNVPAYFYQGLQFFERPRVVTFPVVLELVT